MKEIYSDGLDHLPNAPTEVEVGFMYFDTDKKQVGVFNGKEWIYEPRNFKKVPNKLRVYHYPQVPCKGFKVEVRDEIEALRIMDILAFQHLFLEKHNIIPDYSNAMGVEMWDENSDGEGNADWVDYYNHEEEMEWDELKEEYLKPYTPITNYNE